MRGLLFTLLAGLVFPLFGQEDPCTLLPDPGPCEAAIPAWYIDSATQLCTEFLWGGCEGTVPFETLAACQAAGCIGDTLDYPVCDSIVVTPVSMGTWPSGVDHLTVLVDVLFASQVWISYCGFALSDADGHLIAAETPLTAPTIMDSGAAGAPILRNGISTSNPGSTCKGHPLPFPGRCACSRGGWVAVPIWSANGPGQRSTSRPTSRWRAPTLWTSRKASLTCSAGHRHPHPDKS